MNKNKRIYTEFAIKHDEAIADILGYPVSHILVNYSIGELEEYFRTRRSKEIESQYIDAFVEIYVRMLIIKMKYCERE